MPTVSNPEELNSELSAQLEAAQRALAAATGSRAAAVESEMRALKDAGMARDNATALQTEASAARSALDKASKVCCSDVHQLNCYAVDLNSPLLLG